MYPKGKRRDDAMVNIFWYIYGYVHSSSCMRILLSWVFAVRGSRCGGMSWWVGMGRRLFDMEIRWFDDSVGLWV